MLCVCVCAPLVCVCHAQVLPRALLRHRSAHDAGLLGGERRECVCARVSVWVLSAAHTHTQAPVQARTAPFSRHYLTKVVSISGVVLGLEIADACLWVFLTGLTYEVRVCVRVCVVCGVPFDSSPHVRSVRVWWCVILFISRTRCVCVCGGVPSDSSHVRGVRACVVRHPMRGSIENSNRKVDHDQPSPK